MTQAPRTALVTGSSRGIGKATAVVLAGRGVRVALAARGRSDLEAAAAEVAAAGPEPLVETCDFGDPTAIRALFERLEATGFAPDILVNNVGVARIAAFAEVDDEEWVRNWQVNVMSAVRCCRLALPGMTGRGWGRVVNVSSSAGKRPSARWAAYAPTKAALQGLTIVLADELRGSGVTVNAVCPGPVRSSLWTDEDGLWSSVARGGEGREEALARVERALPAGRMGEPEEVAEAISFLCSETASWVHGAVLSVDGGSVRLVV
ncbi:MAG: SDR family NAD(P)-dependent oxidoreductase [Gemmatimonadota bacterium]